MRRTVKDLDLDFGPVYDLRADHDHDDVHVDVHDHVPPLLSMEERAR